jgi:hypothetical protein
VHDTISTRSRSDGASAGARSRRPIRCATCSSFLDVPAEAAHARQLCNGRIVDVRHETRDGWHWGQALISSGRGR